MCIHDCPTFSIHLKMTEITIYFAEMYRVSYNSNLCITYRYVARLNHINVPFAVTLRDKLCLALCANFYFL